MAHTIPNDVKNKLHCGVCQFAKWNASDKAPYCTSKEDGIRINLGIICENFQPAESTPAEIDLGHLNSRVRKSQLVNQTKLPESEEGQRIRGSDGPFFASYFDEGNRRYGWFCSACRSVDVGMDPMGRVVCGQCKNRSRPSEWDAAYL